MRFVEFLKATVMLTTAAATALAALSVLVAASGGESLAVWIIAGWWLLAGAIGSWAGRRSRPNAAIARLLAGARVSATLPEQHAGSIIVNRLWPLALLTLIAGGLAALAPQIPGIGAGFALVWGFAWRRQHAAVSAIEMRDGVSFYVERTSPLKPIALLRTPGFKALQGEPADGALR